MVREKDADVDVDGVELAAHLGRSVHATGRLVTSREPGLVGSVARGEAGDVEVAEGLVLLYVLQGDPPGHIAVGRELAGRLAHVDVAIHDEDVLGPILFLPRPSPRLCHAAAPFPLSVSAPLA